MASVETKKMVLLPVVRRQKEQNAANWSLTQDNWAYYGSEARRSQLVFDYQDHFEAGLNGISLVNFTKSRKAPTVLDLMAPSDTLANLFSEIEDADKIGIAVSFLDKRSNEKVERDRQLNIHQIGGDIMKSTTWKEIRRLLNGRKVDLIMERALAGLFGIPNEEEFYAVMLNRIWNMLSDQGGMFVGEVLPDRLMVEKFKMYAQFYGVDFRYILYATSAIVRLIKTPSSPKDLRFLT